MQSAPVFDDGPGGGLDDEEVQAAMARMRREAGRMRNRTMKAVSAQELARRREELLQKDVKAEDEEDEEDLRGDTAGDADGEVRVLDDTTEFIRNIGLAQREQAEAAAKKAAEEAARAASASAAPTPAPRIKKEEDGDVALEELGDEDVEMGEESPDEEEKAELLRLLAGDEAKPEAEGGEVEGIGGTGKEQYVSGGLAATLSILKQQGLIKPLTEEEREKERMYREKTAWQTEQRRLDALRKLERQQSRKAGGNKDQAQREYENRQREAQAARDAMESFRHYKPHVEIKYNDEFGRVLSPKEAWKALSHKFHGKGSGKTKTEKRIKKIEEEKKMVHHLCFVDMRGILANATDDNRKRWLRATPRRGPTKPSKSGNKLSAQRPWSFPSATRVLLRNKRSCSRPSPRIRKLRAKAKRGKRTPVRKRLLRRISCPVLESRLASPRLPSLASPVSPAPQLRLCYRERLRASSRSRHNGRARRRLPGRTRLLPTGRRGLRSGWAAPRERRRTSLKGAQMRRGWHRRTARLTNFSVQSFDRTIRHHCG